MFTANILIHIFLTKVVRGLDVPVVETKYGAVRGVYEESEFGEFFMYMGIPFGQLREDNLFGDAVDPDPWGAVLEANSDSSICPQREEFNHTLVGDPHCLHLNVYVPAKRNSSEPLSVLFWIYGGGYKIGFKSRFQWGPEYLIRHDIIMVSVNYRLGPYGFMCLGTEQVPGNAGIKDVVKGLRWVSENIAAFGGNPNDLTIGGSSSGSSIVEFFITSKYSHLFRRAILQSGSATLTANVMNETSEGKVESLARFFNHEDDTLEGNLHFLQMVHHFDVLLAVEELNLDFDICVEPIIEGIEPFFTKGHTKAIASGDYPGTDILIGFNCNEFAFKDDITEETIEELLNTALSSLTFEDEFKKKDLTDAVRQFYIGNQTASDNIFNDLSKLASDYKMISPVYLSLQYLLQNDITAFYYDFCYKGGRNFAQFIHNITVEGAVHTDEIGYLFKQGIWTETPSTEDALVIDRMTTMWTNFIKFGNPTPEVTKLLPVLWTPVTNEVKNYLKISNELTMDKDPLKERMDFWDQLISQYFEIWRA